METTPFKHEQADLAFMESQSESFVLLLHNDDVNTFDHVIDSLVDVCDHDPVQAEQCALIVHYQGKCDVKHGSIRDLTPCKRALNQRGLEATIERN